MEEIRAAKDSSVFTIMKKSPYDLYPLRLSVSQMHVYLPGVNGYLAQCLNSVLNVKALVGTFNQEKALVGAFSVIVQPVVEPMEHYTALMSTTMLM